MNEERFKQLFPRASDSCRSLNVSDDSTAPDSTKFARHWDETPTPQKNSTRTKQATTILPNPHVAINNAREEGYRMAERIWKKTIDENHPNPELQNPVLEHNQAPALGAAVSRESQGVPIPVIRFVGYRTRPLDPDNFAAGCKDLLDGLRHSGLLQGDEPWKIDFQTTQVKVAHRSQEKTVIELEYPENPLP